MAELRGMTPWDLKPAYDAKSFAALVEPLRRSGREMLFFDTDHRRKDGSIYTAKVCLQYSGTGNPPVFFAIITDITQQRKAEAELCLAKEAAETANRSKTDFLAHMSHELRTPLNAVIGFSEIIADEIFGPIRNDQYLECASDINASGRLLLELINDILDVSVIESGKLKLNEQIVNVHKLVNICIRLVKGRATNAGLELVLDAVDKLPSIFADERRLKQVLINLLTNAIKFTDRGAVTLRVRWQPDKDITFAISDTSKGISESQIKNVLTPFGRVDVSQEGAGLGLPLSKSLVELHGGTLEIQSEIGKGTMVTVKLPKTRVQYPTRVPSDGTGQGISRLDRSI